MLLFVGLHRLSGVAASLLLNLEAPFPILLAVWFFRDHVGEIEIVAIALIVLGAVALTTAPADYREAGLEASRWSGACPSWAIDNNLTQRLSIRDPLAIVRVKALSAAPISFGLAFSLASLRPTRAGLRDGPRVRQLRPDVVFAVRSLRLLGAAREAAYFATGPFIGALVAAGLLGERLGAPGAARDGGHGGWRRRAPTGGARAPYTHEVMEHDHAHVHDEHHTHEHDTK